MTVYSGPSLAAAALNKSLNFFFFFFFSHFVASDLTDAVYNVLVTDGSEVMALSPLFI